MREFGLDDRQLFPLLDERGDQMLRRLREHPQAPKYNWRTGERLTQEGLASVNVYAQRVRQGPTAWQPGQLPSWVFPFVRRCRATVPFYRNRTGWPEGDDFFAIPPTRRQEIRRQPWAFVADGLPLRDMIVYSTSGTLGTRLTIPATPELPNRYLPLIERALTGQSIRLEGGGQRVSIIHVCAQNPTVVLCSISSYLGGAGFAKINLHPSDWNQPNDAIPFLEDCNPELYTGDPFALWRLSQLPLRTLPKAILSSGTALSAGLRRVLSSRFQCPVIDVYSLNETGPIGFSATDGNHEILQPELYVEIVDEQGKSCGAGVRGEIVVTGGINPYLPLIRYGTGDYAALDEVSSAVPRLIHLLGRRPVAFRDTSGRWFNSIDVASALGDLALPGFSLHQRSDGSLVLKASGDDAEVDSAVKAIIALFGNSQAVELQRQHNGKRSSKVIAFSSDLEPVTEMM